MYVTDIVREFPDGATAAVFYTNNDFGQIYSDAFEELAGDNNIEIIDTQTIEAPEDRFRRRAQVSSIAGNAPDVIMAAPLGAHAATFAQRAGQRQGGQPRLGATGVHHQHVRQPADPRRVRRRS